VNSAGKEEAESGRGIVGEASGGKGAVTDSEDQLSDDDNPKSVASRSNSEQSAESSEEEVESEFLAAEIDLDGKCMCSFSLENNIFPACENRSSWKTRYCQHVT